MEMATLGKTGLQVSRLGAGLAELGSLTDVSIAGRLLNIALDDSCIPVTLKPWNAGRSFRHCWRPNERARSAISATVEIARRPYG